MPLTEDQNKTFDYLVKIYTALKNNLPELGNLLPELNHKSINTPSKLRSELHLVTSQLRSGLQKFLVNDPTVETFVSMADFFRKKANKFILNHSASIAVFCMTLDELEKILDNAKSMQSDSSPERLLKLQTIKNELLTACERAKTSLAAAQETERALNDYVDKIESLNTVATVAKVDFNALTSFQTCLELIEFISSEHRKFNQEMYKRTFKSVQATFEQKLSGYVAAEKLIQEIVDSINRESCVLTPTVLVQQQTQLQQELELAQAQLESDEIAEITILVQTQFLARHALELKDLELTYTTGREAIDAQRRTHWLDVNIITPAREAERQSVESDTLTIITADADLVKKSDSYRTTAPHSLDAQILAIHKPSSWLSTDATDAHSAKQDDVRRGGRSRTPHTFRKDRRSNLHSSGISQPSSRSSSPMYLSRSRRSSMSASSEAAAQLATLTTIPTHTVTINYLETEIKFTLNSFKRPCLLPQDQLLQIDGSAGGLHNYFICTIVSPLLTGSSSWDQIIANHAQHPILSSHSQNIDGFKLIKSPTATTGKKEKDTRQLFALLTHKGIHDVPHGSRLIFAVRQLEPTCFVLVPTVVLTHNDYEKLYNNQHAFDAAFNISTKYLTATTEFKHTTPVYTP